MITGNATELIERYNLCKQIATSNLRWKLELYSLIQPIYTCFQKFSKLLEMKNHKSQYCAMANGIQYSDE